MESFESFRQKQDLGSTTYHFLALFICIYIFSSCFTEARRNIGRSNLCEKWKIERGGISNEMLFSFSSTERALELLFGSVFEHMHLGTLTVNGVSKQLSLFIDRKGKHLLVTMSNRSQDIASSGWFVVLGRFSVNVGEMDRRGTMIRSFLVGELKESRYMSVLNV